MQRLTPTVRILIIINVIVFIGQQFLPIFISKIIDGQEYSFGLMQLISLWGIRTSFFQPYQFFTYMFAHGGFSHIFFNMMALAYVGPILEEYWGEKKFLICYIVTGVGAGVIYVVIHYIMGSNGGRMLGASGTIYGLLMAFGMIFPNMEVHMLFIPIPIKAKYLVLIVGGLTYLLDQSGSVAHLAHFGGAFMAFLLVTYWQKY